MIRNLLETDAKAYAEMLGQLDQETDYLLYLPGERPQEVGQYQKMITGISKEGLFLGVFTDDKLVGSLMINRNRLGKIHHSGYLVMGLLAEAQGQGLGRQLLETATQWAKEQQLHRLELTVVTENQAAITLYERFGFVKEGLKKDSLYMKGAYYDEWYMALILA